MCIGSREPIYNFGQCEGSVKMVMSHSRSSCAYRKQGAHSQQWSQWESFHAHIYESLWANPSLSGAGSPFSTLANAKACMQIYMRRCKPTRAYLGSQEPILNIGQGEGLDENIHATLLAKSSLSEAGSPFAMLANAKACI